MLDSLSSRCASSDEGAGSHSLGPKQSAKRLREYRVRKLKKLIDCCHKKKIKFPDNIIQLSSCFAKNTELLTDEDLIELIAECNQCLASDEEDNCDTSSDSSRDQPPKRKVRRRTGVLTPTPAQFDPLNPYNQAWSSQHQFQQATMQAFPQPLPFNKPLFPFLPAHQQAGFSRMPHYHHSYYNYTMFPVHQPRFDSNVRQHSFQDPAPSTIENLGSPQMSSTPVPPEDNSENNSSEQLTTVQHDAVANSVDGTNNGNECGNYFRTII